MYAALSLARWLSLSQHLDHKPPDNHDITMWWPMNYQNLRCAVAVCREITIRKSSSMIDVDELRLTLTTARFLVFRHNSARELGEIIFGLNPIRIASRSAWL